MSDVKKSLEKQFGPGIVTRLGDRQVIPVEVVSTGILSLDYALGPGGFPKGRIIEVYGPESGGKTTLTLAAIAEAQKAGGQALFVDAEHAFDSAYARRLGVDVENLFLCQPDSGEQALEVVDAYVKSGEMSIVVVDSVAALVPKAEIEGEMGDSFMGLQARLMSQALRKLTAGVAKSGTILIFINQIREKIGVLFGSPETTTGGRALKFYASVRLDVRRSGQLKSGDKVIGARTKIKVVKNKVGAPYRETEVDLIYGEGFSKEGDLLDLAVAHGIIEKSGAWYSWGGRRLGQGREQVIASLKKDEALVSKITERVREKCVITTTTTPTT